MNAINDMPPHYVRFLRSIQAWFATRWPTRQLSASDMYYISKWAASNVAAGEYIAAFNRYLDSHPNFCDSNVTLSRLHFLAKEISANATKKPSASSALPQPNRADDPYVTVINRLVDCGKQSDNPILRDILRDAFNQLTLCHRCALQAHPDWRLSTEAFYKFKAQCIIDNDNAVQAILSRLSDLLSPQELDALNTLSTADKIRSFNLGDIAKSKFLRQRFNLKLADYFDIAPILAYF